MKVKKTNETIAKPNVVRRSETIKNFGKILNIMNKYKDEVDNGIYDHQEAMIEEIICRFTIVPNFC